MSLNQYRKKRDPKKTSEPFTSSERSSRRGKKPIFVVQRHDASRLHYDFRLERSGALASWAVPKGVPLEPGAKALAVHVEDHPLEYATFHGEIPKGQYGGGTVEIFDNGTYDLVEEKPNGQLTFDLDGQKLKGRWSLVPAHMDGKEQNWLLIKRHDDHDDGAVVVQQTYKPMLASLDTHIPHGDDWAYEVKFDGFRAIAYIRGGECKLVSRNENDLTGRFPEVAKAIVKAVKSPNAVIDGEICRIDPSGKTSFSELQQGSGPLVYYAFDLLELDGDSRIDLPLTERKEQLRELLDGRVKTVAYSEEFDDGDALFAVAQQQSLEGIISKRKSSAYKPGRRTRDWLKIKTENNEEFVVTGYTQGAGRRAGTFGALVLGVNEGNQLRYVGNVGTGFNDKEIARLLKLLKPLHRATSSFAVEPKMPRVRKGDVQWVDPQLVAQVRFGEWTHDGHLRHPAYLGIREDKEAGEVTREQPVQEVIRKGKRELRLSNLDKPFWPDEGIAKGDLLHYYQSVAEVLVPHLKDRPFTMRRYPDGAYGKAFFQKDAPKHMPEWIPRFRALVSTREKAREKKWVEFPLVNDELALLWMVNMGCIDMNTWYSRIDKPDRPDFVLFDLDPTPEVPWTQTVEVALILKQLLDMLELESFPKTSGGKGFHVLVPIDRRSTYEDTRRFAEHVAGAIARTHPKLATTEWSKAKRRGVLIDANQNGEGKTIASVYSVRPKPGAPVSTPLAWDEVNDKLNPSIYTMPVVLERVRRYGDLYAGVLTTRQSLSKALKRLGT
ncbi:MAG: bifunctional non-ous end joining protein LigD [Gaiellaceae bacterium]|nr:bifunctional non-ous end joining protein LigD [Gaiellaceae bacterium]